MKRGDIPQDYDGLYKLFKATERTLKRVVRMVDNETELEICRFCDLPVKGIRSCYECDKVVHCEKWCAKECGYSPDCEECGKLMCDDHLFECASCKNKYCDECSITVDGIKFCRQDCVEEYQHTKKKIKLDSN